MFLVDREKYISQAQEALDTACTIADFEYSGLTLEFHYYTDGVKDGFEGTSVEILPPTP